MPTHKVNLDALIRREPFKFDPSDSAVLGDPPLFKLHELENGEVFYSLLRKPDFQRVTHNWTPQVVAEFVRSFLDGDVIPSIIVWQSQKTNKIYIIDGSHRVSALLAWVNDDYGDGGISDRFFGDISEAQAKQAQATRDLINEKVGGTYKQLAEYAQNETSENSELILRARAIGSKHITVQAITGSAKAAEGSFIRINGNPAIIDRTELDMIRARYKPNAIATRAIVSAGTGYKYWGEFADNKAAQIEKLAKESYDILFGQVVDIKIDSSDVPNAGQPYSQEAFTMVLDLVNMFNDITPAMWQVRKSSKKNPQSKLVDDPDGEKTIHFLKTVKLKASYASGTGYASSLGLDPAVYCYGNTGTFHTGAFLASRKFVLELHAQNKLPEFTKIRKLFEDFLVAHNSFINQLSHAKGSRTRSVESILGMLRILYEQLRSGQRNHTAIVEEMHKNPNLKGLRDEPPNFNEPVRPRHSKAVARAKVVQEILNGRSRCPGCKARYPPSARGKDHIHPKARGGMGTLDNLDFMHPFCNQLKSQKQKSRAAGVS